jgi:hypothetical protein
MSDNYEFEN